MASQRSFSMGEAVRFGWDTMKANIGFFIGVLIVAVLIEHIPSILGDFVVEDFPLIAFLLYLIGGLLGIVVKMGLIKISLKFCDGIKGQFDDLLSSFDLILNYIAASIIYGLIVLVGFLLLIVPGIILGIMFGLVFYFIVDEEMGPIEALKASRKATEGAKWDLFVFGLLLGLINLAGMLCLIVGLFATVPTTLVAYAYVYRQLAAKSGGAGKTMYVDLGV